MEVIELSGPEIAEEAASSREQAVEEANKSPKAPAPIAVGNDKIVVLQHHFSEIDSVRGEGYAATRVDLAIRNVSDSTIATAVFEAAFYDGEGNLVDTVRHREAELKPETSRLIHITSSMPIYECGDIESYDVRLVRMTTTDVEKLQLRRYEITTTETGEDQVTGVVKNISEAKTDAAVVVTFYDAEKENIGVRMVVLREIEPNTVRQYELRFRPQAGDTVRSCGITIGEFTG